LFHLQHVALSFEQLIVLQMEDASSSSLHRPSTNGTQRVAVAALPVVIPSRGLFAPPMMTSTGVIAPKRESAMDDSDLPALMEDNHKGGKKRSGKHGHSHGGKACNHNHGDNTNNSHNHNHNHGGHGQHGKRYTIAGPEALQALVQPHKYMPKGFVPLIMASLLALTVIGFFVILGMSHSFFPLLLLIKELPLV
jgi:hypothetical protein